MYICLHHLSLLICLQLPTLFETSQSPPVLSSTWKGLGVDFASASAFVLAFVSAVGSAFRFVAAFGSLFGVVSTLLLATDSFTVSDFESFQSSSRSSMLFFPAVGFALVLPAIGSALSVLLIFHCCWLCSSRGSCTRVASFLLLTTGSLAVVPSLIPLTTGSLAVVPSLVLQRYFVVVYDSVARFWPPPPLLSIAPLRDRWFAVGALVPRKRSLQQCVLLTMRTGFSFACNFSYTCSAEMSVPLFSGCVHRRKGFHRGLRLGTTVVFQISCSFCLVCSPASLPLQKA